MNAPIPPHPPAGGEGRGEGVWPRLHARLRHHLLTRENLFAVFLCLLLILLLVVTTDAAPTWIYQGF
jgi:hypothetical protein